MLRRHQRGADIIALMPSFDSGIFWDHFLDFERRQDNHQEVFEVLKRLWTVPQYKVAEYHQQFRTYAAHHAPHEYVHSVYLKGFRKSVSALDQDSAC